MKSKIIKLAIRDGPYFEGKIEVYDGNRYLWAEKARIKRLCKVDALNDAGYLKRNLLCENGIFDETLTA